MSRNSTDVQARIDWVDYAKGICIILVVMLHSTSGVEEALGREGFMRLAVDFARPLRMPALFLISGLFLARVIGRDWRTYLDRKVLHFAYFYILWLLIQIALKGPGIAMSEGPMAVAALFLGALVQPFGTLWFIYLLPVFFVVAKLARNLPPMLMLAAAAALEIAPVATGWVVIDEFAARFVYFLAGWYGAPHVFAFARAAAARPAMAIAGIAVWALVNGIAVAWGVAAAPGLSLLLGFAGSAAVIAVSALLARADWLGLLRHAGENSLVLYLGFFIPMAATRVILLKSGLITDAGVVSLIVTAVAASAPLIGWWVIRRINIGRFLFERPALFKLERKPPALQPAE